MFLHLGGDIIIPKKDIILILDIKHHYKSRINTEFLRIAEDEGVVSKVCEPAKAKSFVLTAKNVYYSPISSATLKKRADNVLIEEEDEEE